MQHNDGLDSFVVAAVNKAVVVAVVDVNKAVDVVDILLQELDDDCCSHSLLKSPLKNLFGIWKNQTNKMKLSLLQCRFYRLG